MWLLFGRGDGAVDEISLKHPKPRKADSSTTYAGWWSGLKGKTGDVLRRIQKGDARLESTLSAIIAIGAAAASGRPRGDSAARSGGCSLPVSAVCLVAALVLIHARLGLEDRTRVKRLEAFRRYLREFSDLPNAPALAVVIWEQLPRSGRSRSALPTRSRSRPSSSSSGFSGGGLSGGGGGGGGGTGGGAG
jgi:uncharacterized membrane protein YgcG